MHFVCKQKMKNGKEFWISNSCGVENLLKSLEKFAKQSALTQPSVPGWQWNTLTKLSRFGGLNLGPINPSTTECWVQKSKNYKWQHMINNSCKTSGIHFQKYIFENTFSKIHFQKLHPQKLSKVTFSKKHLSKITLSQKLLYFFCIILYLFKKNIIQVITK